MMSDGLPYSRGELENHPDTFPGRGPLCPRCNTRIPQFSGLSESEASRIRHMISQDGKTKAMDELRTITGCSIRFAKIWVLHEGQVQELVTAPCPYCGEQLATAQARQCKHCFMAWHDPSRPNNLKTKQEVSPVERNPSV